MLFVERVLGWGDVGIFFFFSGFGDYTTVVYDPRKNNKKRMIDL